ncbi:hypothetical protein ABW20_dc0109835 [Dactylellina cionopaga]|nr:hypothetical protein ABW20_dc0109835 [Dactylellina cionopaga]
MDLGTALNVTGLAIELPGLVQMGSYLAHQVAECYKNYQEATKQSAKAELVMEFNLGIIEADFFFLEQNAGRFTPEVRQRLEDALQELLDLFREICEIYSAAKGPDLQIRPGIWATKVKKSLNKLVKEMEKWHWRFISYTQVLGISGFGLLENSPPPRSAMKTRSASQIPSSYSTLISAAGLQNMQLKGLPVPNDQLERIASCFLKVPCATASRQDLVVEYRKYTRNESVERVESMISKTAQILAAADGKIMHVLCCEGYIHRPDIRQYQMILSFPAGMSSPRSLRDVLLDASISRPCIGSRVQLGQAIATAVLYTHTSGLVHKSLRPENILLFQSEYQAAVEDDEFESSTPSLGTPFLTGFGSAREESPSTDSSLRTNEDWECDLYNHPSRQRQPTMRYTMSHDMYSVGVLLLEIGFWGSLISFNERIQNYTLNEDVLQNGVELYRNIREMKPNAGQNLTAAYEQIAIEVLPSEMGRRFAKVVLQCLRAVEDCSSYNGDNERLGLCYIDRILEGLDEIKV